MKFLPVLFMLFPLFLASQQKNRIVGKVVQHSTDAAIPNASVFISGSSLGTVSDSAGNFELGAIPAGNFELIISSVGFATVVYPFSSEKLPLRLTVQMEPKVVELGEVTVEPFDPDGWQKWGRLFLDNFIGTSEAARRCRITNLEKLHFRYNRKTQTITVVADEPLNIINNHLGYTLQYQLEDFIYNEEEGSVLFAGYSLFKSMDEGRDRARERYATKREEVYHGSMMHFMRALYHDQLGAEGFEARRLYRGPNQEKRRVRAIMDSRSRNNITSGGKTVMRLGVAPPEDSMAYYREVMQQQDELEQVSPYVLGADSLLTTGSDSTKQLYFPGLLQVTYKKGFEEKGYLLYRMQNRKSRFTVSVIFLRDESVIMIEPNGYYYPPQFVFTMDYWAWSEKIAHMLPIDYQPPGGKN
jgi:hypothetical protein